MTGTRSRVVALGLVLATALVAGCGSGGFGTAEPTAPPTNALERYVALGDGFAAGPDLGADTSGSGCERSADSYPNQVARALRISNVVDVSCVGATTQALTKPTKAPGSRKDLAAQLDAVTKDTDLVTLGIGIEDGGLLDAMFHICAALPCGKDVVPVPTLIKRLVTFGKTVTTAVRTIQDIAPKATIVIVGYPQLMPPNGACKALPKMTEVQLGYGWLVLQRLNALLRSAAQQTGSSFIDVAALSTDHTACSSTPWVHGARSVPGKARAYHPLAPEQKAVADAVADEVRGPAAR